MTGLSIPDFLGDHLKDIIYVAGAIVTFFVGRGVRKANLKKEEAQAQGSELDNVEAAIKIYRMMLSDLQNKLAEAEDALQVLEKRFHDSLEEKKALEEENTKLKQELYELKSNNQ